MREISVLFSNMYFQLMQNNQHKDNIVDNNEQSEEETPGNALGRMRKCVIGPNNQCLATTTRFANRNYK